ncbi:double-stranded RNA-binding protein 2-like [Humulus lupulus]|uniref:double-stranded RNA-binding protein 2-like n=1 Tax=Humulus lupulus TaxID=3486 RepID=UPI002B416556|nr:double-stranded RNA-binding protein 2-like [Humulus lupulus]XP_062084572.1 double-stranded RNA-binding protein 2-like [Humulus lupulus]
MYKNQLQELAQRSCFNLPSYSCIREGPDHAPRFKATVNFNGETFESPTFCSTLRQAEHAAAEVALSTLAKRGPSRALAARVLDETGVYKNLLQETAHRAGLNLPVYTTIRSGPGHVPVFSCTVELAGMSFTGESARTKKQAQKNAAMAAWSSLRRLAQPGSSSSSLMESKVNEEQEQVIIARVLSSLCPPESKYSAQNDRLHGQQRYSPICSRSTLPAASLFPVQFHSWPYPSYSPEIAMYQLWQQEQLIQHQQHLFQFPVSPSTPSVPHVFPVLQSMLRPDRCLYSPATEQESTSAKSRITIATSGPSLCFSDPLIPESNRGRSTVTIKEIQEEKSEESPKYTKSTVSDPFLLSNINTESRVREPVQEDDRQRVAEGGRNTKNVKLEGSQTGQAKWDFRLPSSCGFNSSRPQHTNQYPPRLTSQKSLRPPTSAPPVTIRTAGSTSSTVVRPQNSPTQVAAPPKMRTGTPSSCPVRSFPEKLELGGVRHSFMAPAVRIRSVVPVCSAPPLRNMPSSSQEGTLPNTEKKNTDQDNMSKATSELGKLRI